MSVFKTFTALVHRDFVVSLPTIKDRIINGFIWATLCISVFEYIMPTIGLEGHGIFVAIGIASSWGFFEVTENISKFIADLEGNRSISYYLTLPLPQSLVFLRLACSNALQAFMVAILIIPLIKVMLWNSFIISNISFLKFIIIFPLIHFFYGCFSLLLAMHIKSFDSLGNVWLRIVYPLWWVGCYQFSWKTLYGVAPNIAYINLLNPMVYVMEGSRSTLLGSENFLPFWQCVGMLLLFIAASLFVGIRGLKKRLDCL